MVTAIRANQYNGKPNSHDQQYVLIWDLRELPNLIDRRIAPNNYVVECYWNTLDLPKVEGGPVSPRFDFARPLKADTHKLKWAGPPRRGYHRNGTQIRKDQYKRAKE